MKKKMSLKDNQKKIIAKLRILDWNEKTEENDEKYIILISNKKDSYGGWPHLKIPKLNSNKTDPIVDLKDLYDFISVIVNLDISLNDKLIDNHPDYKR